MQSAQRPQTFMTRETQQQEPLCNGLRRHCESLCQFGNLDDHIWRSEPAQFSHVWDHSPIIIDHLCK